MNSPDEKDLLKSNRLAARRLELLQSLRCLELAKKRSWAGGPDDFEIYYHARIGLREQARLSLLLLGGMAGEW